MARVKQDFNYLFLSPVKQTSVKQHSLHFLFNISDVTVILGYICVAPSPASRQPNKIKKSRRWFNVTLPSLF